jgi:hypothetical protein
MENRLNQFDAKKEDAVEKYICEPMMIEGEKWKTKTLTKSDAELLVRLVSSEMGMAEEPDKIKEAEKALYDELFNHSIALKIFIMRLDDMGVKMTLGVKIMMACIMRMPGDATLYACYFMKWYKDNGQKEIDLTTWSTEMFPMGHFSEEFLESTWGSQKVLRSNDGEFQPDNLVDFKTAFKSLRTNIEEEDDTKS